jgi:hypothetical protein
VRAGPTLRNVRQLEHFIEQAVVLPERPDAEPLRPPARRRRALPGHRAPVAARAQAGSVR